MKCINCKYDNLTKASCCKRCGADLLTELSGSPTRTLQQHQKRHEKENGATLSGEESSLDALGGGTLTTGAQEALRWLAISDEAGKLTCAQARAKIAETWGGSVSAELAAFRSGSTTGASSPTESA